MVSRIPGRSREITIIVDRADRVIRYAELVSAFDGRDRGTGDGIIAAAGADGGWQGRWQHSETVVVNGGRGPDGRLVLPPPVRSSHAPSRPLTPKEASQVRALARWRRARCPA